MPASPSWVEGRGSRILAAGRASSPAMGGRGREREEDPVAEGRGIGVAAQMPWVSPQGEWWGQETPSRAGLVTAGHAWHTSAHTNTPRNTHRWKLGCPGCRQRASGGGRIPPAGMGSSQLATRAGAHTRTSTQKGCKARGPGCPHGWGDGGRKPPVGTGFVTADATAESGGSRGALCVTTGQRWARRAGMGGVERWREGGEGWREGRGPAAPSALSGRRSRFVELL